MNLRRGAVIAGLLLAIALASCSSGISDAADGGAAVDSSSAAADPDGGPELEAGDAGAVGAEPGSLLAPTLPPPTATPEPSAPAGIPERSGLPTAPNGLLYSGPTPRSHWHAGYAVRTCDQVLTSLSDVDNQVGIHSHDDGLIHIHPSASEATYSGATLGRFLETVGARISTGRLELPGQEPFVDGDMCGDVPGRVAVFRWDGIDATSPSEIILQDPQTTRFLADGELFTISFAPETAPIVKPSVADAMLASSPQVGQPEPAPYVVLPDEMNRNSFRIWPVLNVFPAVADPPPDVGSMTPADRALALCGRTAIPSSDGTTCYERTTPVLAPDAIVDLSARSVGRSPGIIVEITDFAMEDLNAVIEPFVDQGGLQIGVEINEEVLIVAIAPGPFVDNRIAIVGGMTAEVVQELEALLGRTI